MYHFLGLKISITFKDPAKELQKVSFLTDYELTAPCVHFFFFMLRGLIFFFHLFLLVGS